MLPWRVTRPCRGTHGFGQPARFGPAAAGRAGRWHRLDVVVNGAPVEAEVESKLLLSDFLRHRLSLTGTHVGCKLGSCRACAVLVDGLAVRLCRMLAAQAQGSSIDTVEGLAPGGADQTALEGTFHEEHARQCGFCPSGLLMTLTGWPGRPG